MVTVRLNLLFLDIYDWYALIGFFFRSLLPFLWVGPFPEIPQPGKWRTREYCASYYLSKLSSCSWKCRILQLSTGRQVGGDKCRNVQNGKNTKQSSLQGSVPDVFQMIMRTSQQSSSHYSLWLTARNWNSLPSSLQLISWEAKCHQKLQW